MELKVEKYEQPKSIEFNFIELKTALQEKADQYASVVYTEDQIKAAKVDRANLNKLKNALNDERIRREREYMEPFNEFKQKINQIIAIIDKPVYMIDKQIKEYEEAQKDAKRKEIEGIFEIMDVPEWLKFEQIFDKKWLNASVSMKSVNDDLVDRIKGIEKDLATLSELPQFGFEASEIYKSTLDINRALNEGKRLAEIQAAKLAKINAEKKAEEERKEAEAQAVAVKAEEVTNVNEQDQEPKSWVNFSAYLTIVQARELKKFFDDRCIEFKAI